ncbi:hypothetical protein IC582_016323 [Cucumis melo]
MHSAFFLCTEEQEYNSSEIKAGDAEYTLAIFSICNKNLHETASLCGGTMLSRLSIIALCSLLRTIPSSSFLPLKILTCWSLLSCVYSPSPGAISVPGNHFLAYCSML